MGYVKFREVGVGDQFQLYSMLGGSLFQPFLYWLPQVAPKRWGRKPQGG